MPSDWELYAQQAAALAQHYGFDCEQYAIDDLMAFWLDLYDPVWIRSAVIEALYQGRYKAVSVTQILRFWQRRGEPVRHYTHEFERIICSEFGPPYPMFMPSVVGDEAPQQPIEQDMLLPSGDEALALISPTQNHDDPQDFSDQGQETPSSDVHGSHGHDPDLSPHDSAGEHSEFSLEETQGDQHGAVEEPTPSLDQAYGLEHDPIQTFQPEPYPLIWSLQPLQAKEPIGTVGIREGVVDSEPTTSGSIHYFVPDPQSSEFYAKLQSVARANSDLA